MNLKTGAGLALIGAFLMLFVGAILSPPKIYDEPDISVRVERVRKHQSRWFASQAVTGLALALAPVGYFLLASHLRGDAGGILGHLAAGAIFFGSVLGEVYLYRLAIDPESSWTGTSALLQGAVWLTIAGSLTFGLLLLQGGLPAWIGYLTLVAAAISAAVYFFMQVPSFYLISLLYLVTMLIGVALLTQ